MDIAQTIGEFIGTFPDWLILPAIILIAIILVTLFYTYEILPFTPTKKSKAGKK